MAPLLNGLGPDACVGALAARLRRVAFLAGETIYSKGDLSAAAYFLSAGTVTLYCGQEAQTHKRSIFRHRHSTEVFGRKPRMSMTDSDLQDDGMAGEVRAGGSFGELGLFPGIFGSVRLETAVAETDVVAHVLTAEDFAVATR